MIIDGRTIAKELRGELALSFQTLEKPARVTVFVLSEDEATRQYIGIKERTGKELGVEVTLERLPEDTTTQELVDAIGIAALTTDGIIVQLPLPAHIDGEAIRGALPKNRDIDCLGTAAFNDFEAGTGIVTPPVVSAMEHILRLNAVDILDKKVVIVGRGRLVGQPAEIWFRARGANVTVCDQKTEDLSVHTKDADIIVLGAGVPGLLTSDMIKDGVAILDAGASESSGKVVGDADPHCEALAKLFTPVPGGVGPIAIAMLFRNLYILATDI
ncbi:MAG: bifunctional 5,10-methylenetetrahydrofolate dehydrogenase/5,10-methenyltetrahydrofolate cyclohydrolase [Candidatus Pacebacteria bacterium]|nr:bifunctional 5,10-methylenetetrahydrofolate dehydrogenase/5,10-methenyltetrahydrofolate cyclohydrolase [Candidatus Paceibacterota bacterium]